MSNFKPFTTIKGILIEYRYPGRLSNIGFYAHYIDLIPGILILSLKENY